MDTFLRSSIKQFEYYKSLGDKTLMPLNDHQIHTAPNEESNNMSILVKHISGNMLSRWTHIFTEDGEKEWRNRDDEFVDTFQSKKELLEAWEKGWKCLFSTLGSLRPQDIERIIYIRNEGHTVVEAINRQLCHYSYHIGQMIYLGKWLLNDKWESLSIPKGDSVNYNTLKFDQQKSRKHFTDDA